MRWWRWMRRRWRGQAMGRGQPVRSGGRASAKQWRRWLAPSVAGGVGKALRASLASMASGC
eukprot:3197761-Rhodomonas_salina.1